MLIEKRFIHFLQALQLHRNLPDHSHTQIEEIEVNQVHEIFQSSTINALLEGMYNGDLTLGEFRKHGDFGLGTLNALNGERVALDGKFFQVKSDGFFHPINN
jgi:acetolactate decarboxylase